ncbi:MAG: hypothetical protein WKH47_10580 [Actinomycetes bacterium]
MGVEVRVLGSLDVVVDGRSVQIGGPKPRTLLAVLAARGGAVVSVLADALWEGSPPGQPGRSVQVTQVLALYRAGRRADELAAYTHIELAGRHLRSARTALGDQAFAAAWADGQRLGFHEALAEAGLAAREVSDDLPAGSLPPTLTR